MGAALAGESAEGEAEASSGELVPFPASSAVVSVTAATAAAASAVAPAASQSLVPYGMSPEEVEAAGLAAESAAAEAPALVGEEADGEEDSLQHIMDFEDAVPEGGADAESYAPLSPTVVSPTDDAARLPDLAEVSPGAQAVNLPAAMAHADRMLLEASCLSKSKRPKLMWERGVIGRVLGSASSSEPRAFRIPAVMEDEMVGDEQEIDDSAALAASASLFLSVRGKHQPRTWTEAKQRHRRMETKKWLTMLSQSPHTTDVGQQLALRRQRGADAGSLERLLEALLSSRDPLTLCRHRASLEAFASWRSSVGRAAALPVTMDDVIEYLEALMDAPGSRTIQFAKSCAFMEFALGASGFSGVLNNACVKGLMSAASKRVKRRQKRRALTVREIKLLEMTVAHEQASLSDRVMAGSFLFALYSRSRWGELTSGSELRLEGVAGEMYIEGSFNSVKTAAQYLRGSSEFQMLAVGSGVLADVDWAEHWMKARELAGLDVRKGYGVVLCPEDYEGKSWSQIPMDSARAKNWMHSLLGIKGEDPCLSSHSLKTTMLKWANVAGLGEELRRALGYHRSRSTKTMDLYGRDAQAGAARALKMLVGAVQADLFRPDAPRAEMFPKGYRKLASALCLNVVSAEGSGDSSSGEESDVVSSSTMASSEAVACEEAGPEDTELFRHKCYGTVHKLQDGESECVTFRCGRTLDLKRFEPLPLCQLADSKFCSQCFA